MAAQPSILQISLLILIPPRKESAVSWKEHHAVHQKESQWANCKPALEIAFPSSMTNCPGFPGQTEMWVTLFPNPGLIKCL